MRTTGNRGGPNSGLPAIPAMGTRTGLGLSGCGRPDWKFKSGLLTKTGFKLWRCRDSHPGPPTACQNRYRLSPEFVSAGIRSRQQFPAMLRIVLSLRGTKCAPVGSSLNLTQYNPLRRVGYKRGTLKRAPRPSRWSWLLCFLTLFCMAWSTMTC